MAIRGDVAGGDQDMRRSKGRMPGERQFVGRGEYPYLTRVVGVLRRQDKGGFREVELPRDHLHLLIRKTFRFRKNRELVATKDPIGEYVHRVELIASHAHSLADRRTATPRISN